jgi:peptidoglycan/xylan/chitin deacetylase (PgdA/CDA1 family)
MRRRSLFKVSLMTGGSLALGLSTGVVGLAQSSKPSGSPRSSAKQTFWPDGIRLPISISTMFEAGGQPDRNPPTPFNNFTPPPEYPDLPTKTWYRYGYVEGIPRVLELLDRKGIKITSHMTGTAVKRNPQVAKEIVQRGHEAAAHGMSWNTQYNLSREQEYQFIAENVQVIEQATGKKPVGYNAPGLRGTVNTLEILQALGFTYHIDDVSRDEPFIVDIKGKPFVIVPYAVYLNDIRAYEARNFSTQDFSQDLKNAFDYLYEEAATRRRMLAITTHDRLLRPERVKMLEEFINYVQAKPGVKFLRKDEIARIALDSNITIRETLADVYPV